MSTAHSPRRKTRGAALGLSSTHEDIMHTVTAETFAPGTHAVVVMPDCPLDEALRLCINARLSELSQGCNMSPAFTLQHTGHIAHMLVTDLDATVLR